MGLTRQPDKAEDPNFAYYECDDCGYVLPHPKVVRSLPRCPKCAITSQFSNASHRS